MGIESVGLPVTVCRAVNFLSGSATKAGLNVELVKLQIAVSTTDGLAALTELDRLCGYVVNTIGHRMLFDPGHREYLQGPVKWPAEQIGPKLPLAPWIGEPTLTAVGAWIALLVDTYLISGDLAAVEYGPTQARAILHAQGLSGWAGFTGPLRSGGRGGVDDGIQGGTHSRDRSLNRGEVEVVQ